MPHLRMPIIAVKVLYLQVDSNIKHTRMIKNILFTLVLALGMAGYATNAAASGMGVEIVEAELQDITVYVSGSTLHVSGAAGLNLYIYNITGVRVMSLKVDGSDKSYELNLAKGCYIVKVGNVVRKISIR